MLNGSFEEFGLWMEEIEVARVGPAAASLLEQFEMQQQAHRLDCRKRRWELNRPG